MRQGVIRVFAQVRRLGHATSAGADADAAPGGAAQSTGIHVERDGQALRGYGRSDSAASRAFMSARSGRRRPRRPAACSADDGCRSNGRAPARRAGADASGARRPRGAAPASGRRSATAAAAEATSRRCTRAWWRISRRFGDVAFTKRASAPSTSGEPSVRTEGVPSAPTVAGQQQRSRRRPDGRPRDRSAGQRSDPWP